MRATLPVFQSSRRTVKNQSFSIVKRHTKCFILNFNFRSSVINTDTINMTDTSVSFENPELIHSQ